MNRDALTGWLYSLIDGDLIIRKDSSLNQITVRGWVAGQLGIVLTGPVATTLKPINETHVLNDDPRPGTGGSIDLSDAHPGFSYKVVGTADKDNIITGDGDDEITGGGAADRIFGLGGDDRLYGGDKLTLDAAIALAESDYTPLTGIADLLEADTGNDLLIGGTGDNILLGGAGKDTLVGGAGVDYAMGDGFALGFGQQFTFNLKQSPAGKYVFYVQDQFGQAWSFANDTDINGDDDVIYTGHGDDIVNGDLGDDFLSVGSGSDIGFGWSGNDTLDGGAGDDVLFGDLQLGPECTASGDDGSDGPKLSRLGRRAARQRRPRRRRRRRRGLG